LISENTLSSDIKNGDFKFSNILDNIFMKRNRFCIC